MTRTQFLTVTQPADFIALASLNRPEAANALTTAMALEIKDFFVNPPASLRAIILTGSGKHFCAGADLKERKGMSEQDWKTQHTAFRAARDAVLGCKLPVIAAVAGAAFGGGLELALACDFIYAADNASFALTEASLGIMPGMGGTQTLPHAIGARKAKELLYTARKFSAQDAFAMGMVNTLCTPENLLAEATGCAQAIAANAPLAVQSIKKAAACDLAEGFAKELKLYNSLLSSHDRHEGIGAYNEKRPARFTGE